ncbi:hypothetical protein RCH18_001919, partial [Flavobacterium sp. PL11]|nr:hypothetical protein [Flavobacterium sp. PL11]
EFWSRSKYENFIHSAKGKRIYFLFSLSVKI